MAKGNATEDTVNSVIDRFIGDDTGTDTGGEGDADASETGTGAEADAGADGDAAGATTTGTKEVDDPANARGTGDSKIGKGDSAGKQPAQGKTTKDGKTGAGPKDLVDPNTGQVLAKAGHERRVWESASKYTRDQYNTFINNRVQPKMNELQRDLAAANAKVQTFESHNEIARSLQITPEEQSMGLKLVAALKKDPGATIDFLIEQAKANGHNIEVAGKMAGIDASAVSRMVDGKLQPMLKEQQDREAVTKAYGEAENELGQFYQRYPAARVNEEAIDGLLQKFPDLTLETAYLKLSNYMLVNGLDPNQSIRAQMEARNKAATADPANRRPNPGGGRGNPGVVANGSANAPVKFAHEDTSYKDIVREAMREHGVMN